MRKFSAVLLLLITACTGLNPDVTLRISKLKERVEKETIVVDQSFYKEKPDLVFGNFHVYMLVDEARKMDAPNGTEFQKLLAERVSQYEQLSGRKLCQHGYNVNSRKPDIRDNQWGDWAGFWLLTVNCNS